VLTCQGSKNSKTNCIKKSIIRTTLVSDTVLIVSATIVIWHRFTQQRSGPKQVRHNGC